MVKQLRQEDIPEELKNMSNSYYQCGICGSIFSHMQEAYQCEFKHSLNEPPKF